MSINSKERRVAMSLSSKKGNKLNLSSPNSNKNVFGGGTQISKYKQSDVKTFIEGYKKEANQQKLSNISETLYIESSHYKRLIEYYATMPAFRYSVIPKVYFDENSDLDKIAEDYKVITERLSLFDMKKTFPKIFRHTLLFDVFYGYVYQNDSNIQIQKFDSKICRITSIQNDIYNYSIDLDYFDNNEDELLLYPTEIQKATKIYIDRKKSKNKTSKDKAERWYEVKAENSICLKFNQNILEVVPPFVGVFDAVYEIKAFKELRKDKAELDNYKLLTQNLPIRDNTVENNDFMIDYETMDYFHNLVAETLPDNVGIVTSPMKIESIQFDKDSYDKDGVNKANRDFWGASGVSEALFSGGNESSAGTKMSMETDQQLVYDIISQFNSWLNRFLNLNRVSDYFKVDMIEITRYNWVDVYKQYLEVNQYGVPSKTYLASILGIEPVSLSGMATLENNILKIHEKWIPLASSHTMNTKDILNGGEDGRPTNKETGKEDADETERARERT